MAVEGHDSQLRWILGVANTWDIAIGIERHIDLLRLARIHIV